jgi:hypothetical protein
MSSGQRFDGVDGTFATRKRLQENGVSRKTHNLQLT